MANGLDELELALKVSGNVNSSWEHQDRAVYTLESMDEEMNQMLSPKPSEHHDGENNGPREHV